MEWYSEKLPIFELRFPTETRHRGELLSIDPSENPENSCSMGKGLKAASPVGYISCRHSANAAKVCSFGCELNFILFATGIPEPSDEECQEAHTLCPHAKLLTI